MIRPKELRKGNMVRCLVRLPIGFNSPVLAHSQIVELREDIVETTEGFYKYKDIAPIILTEDILLKSGGVKAKDNLIIFDSKNDEIPDVYLVLEFGKFYAGNQDGIKFSIPVESVHHFQNLYYVLTSKDINIVL